MRDTPIDILVSGSMPKGRVAKRQAYDAHRDQTPLDRSLGPMPAYVRSEVGSFVSPKLLPQMADAAEVVRGARTIENLNVLSLAPNLRGAQQAALARDQRHQPCPSPPSREHSWSNVRKTPEEAVDEVRRVREMLSSNEAFSGIGLEVGISTAFGCSLQGKVEEDWVIRLAVMCAEAGARSIGLSDSVGYANPAQVKRMFLELRKELGDKAGAGHFHNTRGQGLANVVSALDAGVTTFDASQGGIGGCPYAPGASGNIVTEDLVFLLESMGLRTGIDIEKLISARAIIQEGLPNEHLYGLVADAGLPKNFAYSSL